MSCVAGRLGRGGGLEVGEGGGDELCGNEVGGLGGDERGGRWVGRRRWVGGR